MDSGFESANPASFVKDLKEYQANQGKYFVASTRLTPKKDAIDIPDIECRQLSTRKEVGLRKYLHLSPAHVHFVTFMLRQNAQSHLASWREPLLKNFSQDSAVKTVDIFVVENPLIRLMSPLITSSLSRSIPVSRHASTLLHYGPIVDQRQQLGIQNALVGYVFLLDRDLRVRWTGHGGATPEEVESMVKCVSELKMEGEELDSLYQKAHKTRKSSTA